MKKPPKIKDNTLIEKIKEFNNTWSDRYATTKEPAQKKVLTNRERAIPKRNRKSYKPNTDQMVSISRP